MKRLLNEQRQAYISAIVMANLMDQIIADCEKHGLLIAVYQGKGQVIPLCTVAKTGRIVKAIKIPDRTMTEIMRASAQQILDACNEKLGGTTNTKEKNCYGK